MPRGEFKHRYWFFADTPNVAWIVGVIWKDLSWRADLYRLLKYLGGCTIPLFQLTVWCEKCVAARHYAVICKQLLDANDINSVRWAVLGLLQDGACTDFFKNLSENSLKGDLSNATTLNPPLFSLVDTFNKLFEWMALFRSTRLPPWRPGFGSWLGFVIINSSEPLKNLKTRWVRPSSVNLCQNFLFWT
jgi:hypothetical protein